MADARKLTTSDWLEMAAELAHHLEDEDESLAFYLTFLEATEETNRVALFDRNSLDENEWRKVVAFPDSSWPLRRRVCGWIGLGRRTFGESAEQAAAKVFEIEWFERKGKKRTQWGQRPAFKLTVASYDKQKTQAHTYEKPRGPGLLPPHCGGHKSRRALGRQSSPS